MDTHPAFIRRGLSVHENGHLDKATFGSQLSSTALPASDTRSYIYHGALYAHSTGLVVLEQGEAPEVNASLHIPEYIGVPLNT